MNLKTQVIGINQLLSDMYRQQMRLSYLLAQLDFDESDLKQLQAYFLPDVVAIFLTTLNWIITSAEIEITQFGLIREIYGLSFGLPNHLSSRQIQAIKHSFLSSLSAANCKPRLESEFKIRIRQLIVAEENSVCHKQPSYFYNADNCGSKYSLGMSHSPEGKPYLTISDYAPRTLKERYNQISIPQTQLSAFHQQLIATVNLQSPPPSHAYEEIRKTYKKAYTQWTKAEEQILIGYFDRGLSIKEIARLLERQPGAISSGINKLNLRL